MCMFLPGPPLAQGGRLCARDRRQAESLFPAVPAAGGSAFAQPSQGELLLVGGRRWGVWADWSAPYLTLQPEYEARWAERSREEPRSAQVRPGRLASLFGRSNVPHLSPQAAQLGVFGAMFLQGLIR